MSYRINKATPKSKVANQDYLDRSLHALTAEKIS